MSKRPYTPKLERVSKAVGTIKRSPPPQTRIRTIGKTGGRQKGTPNRLPVLLKDALIEAATNAGLELNKGKNVEKRDGLVLYLTHQAVHNPQSFLPLLGKVLPLQIDTGGVPLIQVQNIEFIVLEDGVDPSGYKTGLLEVAGTAEVGADGGGDSERDG